MVYHDTPMEEAQKKFADYTATTQALPPTPQPQPKPVKRKSIKTITAKK
jgi:hypothetical protein